MSPVLREEISLYPETLLAEEGAEVEEEHAPRDRHWWVIHTRPRQEKAVARELYRQQISFYLPLVEKTNVYRGWRVTSRTPLFPGYVFLHATEDEHARSAWTNRVSRVLQVFEYEQFQKDLRQIQQLIEAKAPLTVESRLAPGRRVRVRSGSLAGLEGTVVERRGKTRLVVHVNFLQQGASVEIDDYMLEPLHY